MTVSLLHLISLIVDEADDLLTGTRWTLSVKLPVDAG